MSPSENIEMFPYSKSADEDTVKEIEKRCFGNLKMRNNLMMWPRPTISELLFQYTTAYSLSSDGDRKT